MTFVLWSVGRGQQHSEVHRRVPGISQRATRPKIGWMLISLSADVGIP
jgi:hypothetical protein